MLFEWAVTERLLQLINEQVARLFPGLADDLVTTRTGTTASTGDEIGRLRIFRSMELGATAGTRDANRNGGGHGVCQGSGRNGLLQAQTTMDRSHGLRPLGDSAQGGPDISHRPSGAIKRIEVSQNWCPATSSSQAVLTGGRLRLGSPKPSLC